MGILEHNENMKVNCDSCLTAFVYIHANVLLKERMFGAELKSRLAEHSWRMMDLGQHGLRYICPECYGRWDGIQQMIKIPYTVLYVEKPNGA